MCDPCCPPMSSPYCQDPCCPPSCDPCCPPMSDPCCPPDCCMPCDPCCPPSCPPKVRKKVKISHGKLWLKFFSQRCKSRELKGSVLITQCECVKRNGLQLDCPRTECHGRPCCTTKPWPSCCPSKYMWRYTNVTMGKPTNPRPSESCRPKPSSCNPCVVPGPCCPYE